MVKIIVFLVLVGMFPLTATAEIYRCRAVEGALVFTDDPARFPAGCVPEARQTSGGWASFVETPSYMLSDYVAVGLERVVAEAEMKKQLVREYRAIASALVEDYQRARFQRLHSTFARDRRRLVAIIREIKVERDYLLEEIAAARISTAHRNEIEGILSPIPFRASSLLS